MLVFLEPNLSIQIYLELGKLVNDNMEYRWLN